MTALFGSNLNFQSDTLRFIVICAALTLAVRAPAQESEQSDIQQRLRTCTLETTNESKLACFESIANEVSRPDPGPSTPPSTTSRNGTTGGSGDETSKPVSNDNSTGSLLAANDPNYIAVVAAPVSNDLNDENHMEFYISLKYPLFEQSFAEWKYVDADPEKGVLKPWMPDRLYFIYNGLYDFYIYESNRYASSPVLSRLQNPGLSFEWDLADRREKMRLGWFHESNGQTLEKDTTDDGNESLDGLDIFERRLDNHGKDYALASVSRGWDYASLRYEQSESDYLDSGNERPYNEDGWYQYHVEYRWYCDCQGIVGDKEDEIWWEPGNNDEISDYDGLRLMAERGFKVDRFWIARILGRVDYKSGLYSWDAMSNVSWKATLVTEFDFADNFLFMLFYYDGYGKEPSTYQIETQYVGLGFELR